MLKDSLKDYVAVVTGSESGIGLEISREFIEQGATVIGVSKTDRGGAQKLGDRYIPQICNAADLKEIERITKFAGEKFGKIDVLVNNAGHGFSITTAKMTSEDWDYAFGLLLKAPMFWVKHCAPLMKNSKNPSVINIGSCASERAGRGMVLYGVPKAGIKYFTECALLDFPYIRSNLIMPGFIDTPVIEKSGVSHDDAQAMIKAGADHNVPLGFVGEPKDVANVATLLASEEGAYVNGAYIRIDGGWTTSAHIDLVANGSRRSKYGLALTRG